MYSVGKYLFFTGMGWHGPEYISKLQDDFEKVFTLLWSTQMNNSNSFFTQTKNLSFSLKHVVMTSKLVFTLLLCNFKVPSNLDIIWYWAGKAKISIYQLIYIPTLAYGHEFWVVTEIMRLQIQTQSFGLGKPRDPPGWPGECSWGKECLEYPSQPVATVTQP